MIWATQKKGWEQPAENGSGSADVLEPVAIEGQGSHEDEAGTAHVDSPQVSKKNMDWV